MAKNTVEDNQGSYQKLVASEMELMCDRLDQRTFDNMFGVDKTIDMLKVNIVIPLTLRFRFPELFTNILRTSMLFGVPGSGKTHLLSATANASNAKLFVFNLWNFQNRLLVTKTESETVEKCIKTVFQIARMNSPSILCFEDLEVLSKQDDHFRRGKISFLNEFENFLEDSRKDEANNNVFVIGVTQKPWEVDSKVRRKFVYRSHVNPPNEEARHNLLKALCSRLSHSLSPEDFQTLASKTHGFTGSDITVLVQSASMQPVRNLAKATHFKKVFILSPDKSNSDSDTKAQQTEKQEDEATIVSTFFQDSEDIKLPEYENSEQSKNISGSNACCDVPKENQESSKLDEFASNKIDADVASFNFSKLSLDKRDEILSETISQEQNKIDLDKKGKTGERMPLDVIDSECQGKAHSELGNEQFHEKFVPCQADDTDAILMSVFEIPEEKIHISELTMKDMEEALRDTKSSVCEEELQKMSLFESDFCSCE